MTKYTHGEPITLTTAGPAARAVHDCNAAGPTPMLSISDALDVSYGR